MPGNQHHNHEQQFHQRGPHRKRPRDSNDDHYRRPRPHFNPMANLRKDLVRLADPGTITAEDDIHYVARKICTDYANESLKHDLLNTLLECVLELTTKIPHYATCIMLATAENSTFGKDCLALFTTNVETAIKARQWRDAKLLLRVLALCQPMLEGETSFALRLADDLIGTISTDQSQVLTSNESEIIYICLLTLPYVARAGREDNALDSSRMSDIIDRAQKLLENRQLSSAHLHTFKHSIGDEFDQFEVLVKQLRQAMGEKWTGSIIPDFRKLLPVIAERLPSTTFIMPNDLTDSQPAMKSSYFQLYVQQTVESVPSMSNIASWLCRDIIYDVLTKLAYNRKEAARFLIDLETYLEKGIFVLRGTPLDKIDPNGPTWKAEDVVVEAIFSELFRLPEPSHKLVYYHSVLTELCKLVPQAIAPTFGRAIRNVYANVTELDPVIIYRFWDWFAQHLSNFGFNWKWQEWVEDLSLDVLHPKQVFIREAIAKEAELSYNQRIRTTLPQEYHFLIQEDNPGPNFEFNEPTHPYHDLSQALITELQARADSESLAKVMADLATKATENQDNVRNLQNSVLVQCILQNGFQSFSHAMDAIEHNLSTLRTICSADDESQALTVAQVMQFWKKRPFRAATILEKLANYRVISHANIMSYILGSADKLVISSSIASELMRSSINKVSGRSSVVAPIKAEDHGQTVDVDNKGDGETDEANQSDEASLYKTIITAFNTQPESEESSTTAQDWPKFWQNGLENDFRRQICHHYPALLTTDLRNVDEVLHVVNASA